MKKIIILLGIVVILAASYWLYSSGKKDDSSKYRLGTLDKGDVTAIVTASGSLSAVTTVQVGSQVSGIVAKIYVDFNSTVKKGQLLAELDPAPFESTVDQRRADVEKAQVDYRNTKIAYDRSKKMVAEQLIAQSDFDTAEANMLSAQATVKQAEGALKQAETNLSYTKITSPIDGTVVARQYDVGQTVAASFQAPTLFTIAQDLTHMQVATNVDESDIGRIKQDQQATFTVDAYPDRTFDGRVSQIRLSPTVVQNVVTYPVLLDVPNPNLDLKPGMTANVTIPVDVKHDVLRIPNAALRFQPDPNDVIKPERTGQGTPGRETSDRGQWQQHSNGGGGGSGSGSGGNSTKQASWSHGGSRKGSMVYVPAENGKLKPVFVRTSLTDGNYTALEWGDLKEGQQIVTGLATAKAMESSGGMTSGQRRRPF